MKFISTKLVTLTALFMVAASVVAQTALPYRNGFEEATENQAWTLTANDASATNKWVVGTAQKQAGTQSLYISYNGGTNAGYTDDVANVVNMAYRSFDLPQGASYSFFMDYRNQLAGDSLFFCWVDDPTVTIPQTTNGSLPSWVRTTAKFVDDGTKSNWQNAAFTVCGSGQGRLVIVWKKHTGTGTASTQSKIIAVDNVQAYKIMSDNYFTGFDNNEERDGWALKSQLTNVNKWIFGTQVNISNPNALYISYNNSAYGYDGTQAGTVSAYKEFVMAAGEVYNVEFDYLVGGDANDYMYVSVIGEKAVTDTGFNQWAGNTTFVSDVLKNNAKPAAGNKLSGKPTWTHMSFQVKGTGYPVKLVFFWVNNNTKSVLSPAAIDNLSVKRGLDNSVLHADPLPAECATPVIESVVSTGGALVVTWDDDGTSQYELAYRNTYDTIGGFYTQVTQNVRSPYSIMGLEKGAFTIYVRKMCSGIEDLCGNIQNDTSAWAVNHQNVILTGDGCINYGDLNNPNSVTATYGTWNSPATNQAFQSVGVRAGRHTLVLKPSYDDMTVGGDDGSPGLYTIPYGELATVKLGNKETSAECEGLTYKLKVDPSAVLLIMRYAVVLEDPDHSAPEQPRFKLELLNSRGVVINPDCGNVEFVPGTNTSQEDGWHFMNGGAIKWKDWTTIGLNLEEYAGQDIQIRLSTWDCSQGAHFGYAYFMMDCASKQFEGFSCESQTVDTIFAPEGFAYCWYKKYNTDGSLAHADDADYSEIENDCLSTERGFAPTSITDTTTYVCRVILKTEQGPRHACYFNISSRLAPRFPSSNPAYQHKPDSCINYVEFVDNSVIYVGSEGSDEVEYPTNRKWIIREQSETGRLYSVKYEKNPKVAFPNEGGTYHVSLVTILDGLCQDTAKITINVPKVGDVTKNQKITTCREQVPYRWRGKNLTEDGIYMDSVKMPTGCDSVFILDFKVADKIEIEQDTTICQGDVLLWEGDNLTETGVYTKQYASQVGCDSIMIMNLKVNPVMDITIKPFENPICADDPEFTMNYNNTGGSEPTKYILNFADGSDFAESNGDYKPDSVNKSIVVPIPVDIRPNNYTVSISFEDDKYGCKGATLNVPFQVEYKASTIEQNWGDVISVLNDKYNGGYQFSKYQWYKDGEPIAGETKSYLYVSGGLEVGSNYNVELTRVGEDYAIFTCPIEAKAYTSGATPNFVSGASNIRVYDIDEPADVYVYNAQGIRVSHQVISPESPEYVAPNTAGIYIVRMQMQSGIVRNFKIVVAQ